MHRSAGDTSSARWWAVTGVVAAVAVVARLVPVLRGGGLHGLGNYDDAVYYAASAGLAHGLLPYRDFLLLHPPGLTLLLLPFAGLGRLIGDGDAMAVARVAFIGLGAANAVLASRMVWSLGTGAALVAGLFAAVFYPSVYIGHSTLLETPATTCTLAALLILLRLRRTAPTAVGWLVGAGALLGFSASIKIWGAAVGAAVIGWVLVSSGIRRAGWTLLGAGLGAALSCAPFFLAAPRAMWRMVVLDQLGRPATPTGPLPRLSAITGLTTYDSARTEPSVILGATALVLVCCIIACWSRTGRLAVVVFAASAALLLSTPSWYFHYAGLTAAPLAIIVGCAVAAVAGWSPGRWLRTTLVVAAVGGLALYAVPVVGTAYGRPFPAAELSPGVAAVPGCVTADDPTTLVELNLLQRNLARGCPLMVDLSGYNYELPPLAGPAVPHVQNARWQQFALDYLRSGDATIVTRSSRRYGFAPDSAAQVSRWPVLVGVDGFSVQVPREQPRVRGG